MKMSSLFAIFLVVILALSDCLGKRGVCANSFDICGQDVIRTANGNVSFNFSSVEANRGPFECRRVISVKSGRVKLVLNTRTIDMEDSFTVYDGATTAFKILPLNSKEQPATYETSGNTMLLILKGVKPNKDVPSREIRGTFSVTAFQDSCKCRGVLNGVLRCMESFTKRECSLKCDKGYVDLFPSAQPYTCDLGNGQWQNKSVHSETLSCQQASEPDGLRVILQLTYGFSECSLYNASSISKQIGAYLKANKDITRKGECFKATKSSCNLTPLNVTCEKKGNQSVVTVVVQDTVANLTTEKHLDLVATYSAGLSIDLLRSNLDIKSGNASYSINDIRMDNVTTICPDGLFYIAPPMLDPVCSKCPRGHYHEAGTSRCKKCLAGQFAAEGSTSCTVSNDTLPMVPVRRSCENKCMEGKEVDTISGHCQWCPDDTYQSSHEVLNPKCSPCPDGKKTLYTGAKSSKQCLTPCAKRTFFNVTSSLCELCPIGTFMDQGGHVMTYCESCGANKTTIDAGHASIEECVEACKLGYIYHPKAKCSACAVGSYQDKATNQVSCIPCPKGKSTLGPASTSSHDCIQTCNKGTSLDKDNGNACKSCPKGSYMSLEGHLQLSCVKCDSNKSTAKEGAVNASECQYDCVAGQFYSVMYSKCVGCRVGSYQHSHGQDSCIQCPPGMTTVNGNQTSKVACVKLCHRGEYLSKETNNCSPCPLGTYQNDERHTKTDCQPCASNMSITVGATNQSSCTKICDTFPCMGGAECSETEESFVCKCPHGLSGKLCDVIPEVDSLEKVVMSVRFTGLDWDDSMSDQSSVEYKKTKGRIEMAVRRSLREDTSIKGVKVIHLKKGSVIADFDLYMDSSNTSLVPAKSLQTAVAHGSINGLPVDSKSLRIVQQSCRRALGMASGRIADGQITASSYKEGNNPSYGRLQNRKGWVAQESAPREYLQIHFLRPVNITGVATQGASAGYVTLFTISYSGDGATWMTYGNTKKFTANNDTNTEVRNDVQPPISGVTYIRVTAASWSSQIGLRVELYGCITDPVLRPDEIPTQMATTEPPKQPGVTTGPNVGANTKKASDEYAWGKYLGIAFGLLLVIGVILAAFVWWGNARRKAEREKSPLVMTRFQDSDYKVIEKNDEYDDEHAV